LEKYKLNPPTGIPSNLYNDRTSLDANNLNVASSGAQNSLENFNQLPQRII